MWGCSGLCGAVKLSMKLGTLSPLSWGAVFRAASRAVDKGPCRDGQPHIPGTPHSKLFVHSALTGLQPKSRDVRSHGAVGRSPHYTDQGKAENSLGDRYGVGMRNGTRCPGASRAALGWCWVKQEEESLPHCPRWSEAVTSQCDCGQALL